MISRCAISPVIGRHGIGLSHVHTSTFGGQTSVFFCSAAFISPPVSYLEAYSGLYPQLFGIDAERVRLIIGVFHKQTDFTELEPNRGIPLATVVE